MNQLEIMAHLLSNLADVPDNSIEGLCSLFRTRLGAEGKILCTEIVCEECPLHNRSSIRDCSVKLKEAAQLSSIVEG